MSAAPAERTKNVAVLRALIATAEASKGKEFNPDAVEVPSEVVTFLKHLKDETATTHVTRGDRRFPNVNQAANCWTAFNEFQLCVEKRSADDHVCLQRGRDYTSVCPEKWIESFKDAASKGVSMSVGKAFLT